MGDTLSKQILNAGATTVAAAVLSLVLALASNAAERSSDLRVAELIPFAPQAVSTEVILPSQDGISLLGEGWKSESESKVFSIEGSAATLRFYSATEGPLTLETEARSFDTSTTSQTIKIKLNGKMVAEKNVTPGWTRYEFVLPSGNLLIGWNQITLILEPEAHDSQDAPGGAKGGQAVIDFRRIEIHPTNGREIWAERPNGIQVDQSNDGSELISMPTDSILEFFLSPSTQTRLTGSVDGIFEDSTLGNRLWGSIELVEESGETHELLRTEAGSVGGWIKSQFGISSPPKQELFDLGLGDWAGRPVKVRLRAWGNTNGLVRWGDLSISTAGDPTIAATNESGSLVFPPRSERLGRPDIVIILVDTARRDVFESGSPLTPHTNDLASNGTRFTQGVAPSSWTGQSVPALLTGQYPTTVAIEVWGSQLPDQVPTLPELLKKDGYHTVVWSQHNIYRGNESFRRGFSDFKEIPGEIPEERHRLPDANDLFVKDKPNFALIHLLPPHGPYLPPAPFSGSLTAGYTGDVKVASDARTKHREGVLSEDDLHFVRSRYDENVRFADDLIGRIVEMLKAADRYDDALIIITADHGEAFLEHDEWKHTTHLYDEFISIPFIVKWPGGVDGFAPTVDANVSLVDFVPTLVDGLGLSVGVAGFQGRTLMPLVFDDVAVERPIFSETRGTALGKQTPRPFWALIDENHKIIFGEGARLGPPETFELFDIAADPTEKTNLFEPDDFLSQYMLQSLRLQRQRNEALATRRGEKVQEPLGTDMKEKLRALGYIE